MATKAAVATSPLTTEVRRFPTPDVGDDDALLRVEASGICGTDWEIYRRETRGRGLGPLILGHEIVGRVEAIGSRAAERWGVAEGDRVALEEFLPCGRCRLCRSGHYRLCDETDSRSGRPVLRYGCTPTDVAPGLWGGFAERVYVHPRAIVHRVPPHIPEEVATLFIPISNGVQWVVREGGLGVGGSILIIGPGQHGLGCVVAARESGAATIVVAGTSGGRERLALARQLGATHVIESDREDVVEAVKDITDGELVDLVVDLTPGASDPVRIAVAAARKRGVVLFAGSKHGRAIGGFAHDEVVRKELTLRGVRGHDHAAVEAAIAVIASGRYPLEGMCTHTFGLEDVDRALRVVGERTDRSAVHVSVVPE